MKIVHKLEEKLQKANGADQLSGQTLSREGIETHVEKVIVDYLGFFEIAQEGTWYSSFFFAFRKCDIINWKMDKICVSSLT